MKLRTVDLRLLLAIILSHLLLFFSFQDKGIFWYIYTGSLLLLITFAILQVDVDDQKGLFTYLSLGILSGLLLYCLFWIGYHGVGFLKWGFQRDIHKLYGWYGPSQYWEFFALILVAGPGEEIFWRGFVQKRLMSLCSPKTAILFDAILFASVNIYSGKLIFIIGAFISGIVWGSLYYWKKSMPLVIVSHIIFDIMLFIILPLK